MDLALADQCVLITGASGGIGRALAAVFAEEHARLVLVGGSRSDELARYVAAQPWSGHALCVRADLTVPGDVERAFAAGSERFGRVDHCIANAGRWPVPHELLHAAGEQRIRDTVASNLLASTWTARAFMAALARIGPRTDGHGASLCFVGSTAGRFGERGHADYALSKSGLVGLVHSLKNEIVLLDPFARVNMVEPGWTVTHMVRAELSQPGAIAQVCRTMPLRQLGRAVDVARCVAMLTSPRVSHHTTGQILTLAGGMEGRTLWSEAQIDEQAVRARLERE
jgi:3-oxoacyl-[acyl-carrier protein] reductase